MEDSKAQKDTAARRANTRGVSYPFINLSQAIEMARKFYGAERKSSVPVAAAIRAFGYSETSSGGRQTISALLQFGLLEDTGKKDDRLVKLTDAGLTVLLAEADSPDRNAALKECVVSPKIYREIFAKYPDELPSNNSIAYHLQKDMNFNPNAVESFINDLRASLAFAGAEHPRDLRESDPSGDAGQQGEQPSGRAAQDVVAWRPMQPIGPDGRGATGPGGNSGVPGGGNQRYVPVAFQDPTTHVPVNLPIAVSADREYMRGNLSKTTEFRLVITGHVGVRELGRLIRLLEAQKEVLSDDDEDTPKEPTPNES